MDRSELEKYITDTYGVEPDRPWVRYPGYDVFRHKDNKKWFAVVMNVPKNKLGLQSSEEFDIVNLKCDPVLAGSFLMEKGIFPAYHMSKGSWISVSLDGSVDDNKIKMLLDISYTATGSKAKRRK